MPKSSSSSVKMEQVRQYTTSKFDLNLKKKYDIYRQNDPDSIDGWISDTGRWIWRNSISQH